MVVLQFDNFGLHTATTVRNLFTDSTFCDVTLACDSQGRIDAHKFLLSSASTIFKNIFSESTLTPQMVFLRGVKFEDLAALVKFIYLGEVTVEAENVDSFFSTARDLEIEGLINEKHSIAKIEIPNLLPNEVQNEMEDEDSDDHNISEYIKYRTKLIEDQTNVNAGPSSSKGPSHFLWSM